MPYSPPVVPVLAVPEPPPVNPTAEQWRLWYERAWYWLQIEQYKMAHQRAYDDQQAAPTLEAYRQAQITHWQECNPQASFAGVEEHFGVLLDAVERYLDAAPEKIGQLASALGYKPPPFTVPR